MKELVASTVEQTEMWMHGHQRTAIFVLASSLVAIGAIIGLAVATNVYDDGMTQLFREASETNLPVLINDRLYTIQNLGTLQEFPLINSSLLDDGSWVCGNGSRGYYENECIFIPEHNSTQWLYDKVSNCLAE